MRGNPATDGANGERSGQPPAERMVFVGPNRRYHALHSGYEALRKRFHPLRFNWSSERAFGMMAPMPRLIEPVGNRANGFREADAWDREQIARMSLEERLRVAELLRQRVYGSHAPDVRDSERRR